MILVVAGSFFVRWPHMPVDPSTIAGAAYYVCDSHLLDNVEGTSILRRKERGQKVESVGERYVFEEITGVSGVVRTGVDVVGVRAFA
jgi:hypothetical protein